MTSHMSELQRILGFRLARRDRRVLTAGGRPDARLRAEQGQSRGGGECHCATRASRRHFARLTSRSRGQRRWHPCTPSRRAGPSCLGKKPAFSQTGLLKVSLHPAAAGACMSLQDHLVAC
ncbi:uncharacterized protein GJ701_016703 [Geothlypis trichas]